jgi:hypothetical protein
VNARHVRFGAPFGVTVTAWLGYPLTSVDVPIRTKQGLLLPHRSIP